MRVVVDTNVFIGACLGAGASNTLIGHCISRKFTPLMGNALFAEYEDVLARGSLFEKSRLEVDERGELFDIFASACEWVRVYYQWRPNLSDEADNHLVELAVAGNAQCIVSRNIRDLTTGQLVFPQIQIFTPEQFLKEYSL
jgi:putative PIN family toxin of toxin-antitoxin system